MNIIATQLAPAPAGHYSQAIVANGFVFVAGQLPIIPGPEKKIPNGIEEQCLQVMGNVRAILEAAGSRIDLLVNVQVFITDVAHWPVFNAAFESALGAHRPARTVIPCGPLRHGALVEVNAIALAG